MEPTNVTSTDFKNRTGQYLDQAAKTPVIITRHNRPSRVLIDIEEYERMKRLDTREYLTPADLSQTELSALESSRVDPRHNHLNDLLD